MALTVGLGAPGVAAAEDTPAVDDGIVGLPIIQRVQINEDRYLISPPAVTGQVHEGYVGFTFSASVSGSSPGAGTLVRCAGANRYSDIAPRCASEWSLGAVSTQPAPGLLGLNACQLIGGNQDRFESGLVDCEKQTRIGNAPFAYLMQQQSSLNLFSVGDNGPRLATTRLPPKDYRLVGSLGYLLPLAAGRRPVYQCKPANGDWYLSTDANCGGQGGGSLEGSVLPGKTPGVSTRTLYGCRVGTDRFPQVNCPAGNVEAVLGELPTTQTVLYRAVKGAERTVSAGVLGGDYRIEFPLGRLARSGGPGRKPLYGCLAGADQFVSLDAGCEGAARLGLYGWIFDQRPDGVGSAPLYRCVDGAGQRLASTLANCEGLTTSTQLMGFVQVGGGAPRLPLVDRDRDGVVPPADCDDGNPRIKPGATDIPRDKVDQDCSGRDARYPRLKATIRHSWSAAARSSRIRLLAVRGAPKGATVELRCSGRSCPKELRRKGKRVRVKRVKVKRAGRVVNLRSKALRRARLRVGTVIDVRVRASRSIGIVRRFKIRARRLPSESKRCLQPGKATPRKRCKP